MGQTKKPGTGRGNWTYDPKIHIQRLMEVFSHGGDISTFCAQSGISRTTYYNWRDSFSDFAEAIAVATEVARSWWEENGRMSLTDPHFNTNAWRLIMRNRFDMTDTRCVSIPGLSQAKSFKAQHRLISKAIERGEVTPDEAMRLANFIGVGAKLDQIDDFAARLKVIEDNVAANKA